MPDLAMSDRQHDVTLIITSMSQPDLLTCTCRCTSGIGCTSMYIDVHQRCTSMYIHPQYENSPFLGTGTYHWCVQTSLCITTRSHAVSIRFREGLSPPKEQTPTWICEPPSSWEYFPNHCQGIHRAGHLLLAVTTKYPSVNNSKAVPTLSTVSK